MAVYKVAQDVEADDKLIGPFSARQFIYLVVAVVFGGAAWGLSQIFIGLAIIPLPLVFLFVVLALPLRKDQPMEVYLGALISYFLKQRKRIWIPDGVESLVEITVPKTVEVQRTKSISENEAERCLCARISRCRQYPRGTRGGARRSHLAISRRWLMTSTMLRNKPSTCSMIKVMWRVRSTR
jgi:hypothetical protein